MYCPESDIEIVLKHLDRDRISLDKVYEVVFAKLCLEEDEDTLSLLWVSESGYPCQVKTEALFFWFWDHAKVNDKGCIQLICKVLSPAWANNTPKRAVSKSPKSPAPTRRSPRLNTMKNNSARKKLFGDLGGSSNKPVVLDEETGVQEEPEVVDAAVGDNEEEFDQAYWAEKLKDDDFIIQLENTELDECHPVEDPEKAAAYSSDEDNGEGQKFGSEDGVNGNEPQSATGDGGNVNDKGNTNLLTFCFIVWCCSNTNLLFVVV